MHRSTLPIALTAAVVGLGLTALPAAAEERVCKGALGAVTVDNLREVFATAHPRARD